MAASAADYFKQVARRWVGQIGAGGVSDASTTTIPLSSSTNLPTGTGVVVVIDRVDSNGTSTASLEETITGVVSGSNLVTCTRGVEGTAQAHNAGAVVEVLVTASYLNDITTGVLVQHDQTGRHTNITASNITASATATLSHVTASDITSLIVTTGTISASATSTLSHVTASDITARKIVPVFGSDAQGDVYYNDGSKITALPAGTSGLFLKTQGAGANPVWASAGGVGTDGWTSVSDSWSYASANTVTVPSGAASLYQVGDRVKFTQTTVKYFVITAVADTVLTFAVSTDYVVANAAISSISYSHQLSPVGFPQFFAYTPTGVAGSNVTLTGRFSVMGRRCYTRIKAAFSGAITFTTMPTLPITASASIIGGTAGSSPCGTGGYLDNGTATSSDGLTPSVPASATTVTVTKSDGSALSATVPITWANGDTMTLDFAYEI